MPITTTPEWQTLALYAVGAAAVLILIFRIPYVGRLIRGLTSFVLFALCIYLLLQHAPFDPNLSRLTARFGLDGQRVVGREVRIQMAPDGHFWARVRVNGVERRMLVDSGATVTAVSENTAELASITREARAFPVILQTANGEVQADTGTVRHLRLEGIEARNLKVVISPALGPMDVLGMNFLSQLASWRVEGRTLILVPARGRA